MPIPHDGFPHGRSGSDDSNPLDAFIELEPDGVFVRAADNRSALAWHPACEIDTRGSPDPLTAPWLPFPFSAEELAAFMCGGWGEFVRERFGPWDSGPWQHELRRHFLGRRSLKAAEVLTAAYEAARGAIAKAPPLESRLPGPAEGTRLPASRRAAYRTRLRAEQMYSRWRRAVVQHLLLPTSEVPLDAFRDRVQGGASAAAIPATSTQRSESAHRETDEDRKKRRLAMLRAEGGDMVKRRSDMKWQQKNRIGALARLVKQEQRNSAPYSCEKSVRRDLEDAAAAEDDARRAGQLTAQLVVRHKV